MVCAPIVWSHVPSAGRVIVLLVAVGARPVLEQRLKEQLAVVYWQGSSNRLRNIATGYKLAINN